MRVVTAATVATVVRLLHDDPGRYTRRRRGVGGGKEGAGRRGRGGGGQALCVRSVFFLGWRALSGVALGNVRTERRDLSDNKVTSLATT